MMTIDPEGDIFWLIPALIGSYLSGSAANGTLNPFKWDWSSPVTWAGIIGGAFQGVAASAGMDAGLHLAGIGKNWKGVIGKSLINRDGIRNWLSAAGKPTMGKVWRRTIRYLTLGNAGMHTASTVFSVAGMIEHPDNAAKIMMGNFYYNPRRTMLGQIWEGISRGSYESLQQGFGSMLGNIRNTFDGVSNVDLFDGAVLINNNANSIYKWGLTMGNMINSQNVEARTDDAMFMHEYGHTQQSMILGPLYPFAVGIPSGFSALGSEYSHSQRWYEMSANRHAARYFGNFHGVDWGGVQINNRRLNGETKYPTHTTY